MSAIQASLGEASMAKLQEADRPEASMADLRKHLEEVMVDVDDLRKKIDNAKDQIEKQQNPILKQRLQRNIDTRLQVALDEANQKAADTRAQIEVIEKATNSKKRDASELDDSEDSEDSDDDDNRPVKKQKATHDATDSEVMMSEAFEATTRKEAVPNPKQKRAFPSTANAKKAPSSGPSSTGNHVQQTIPLAEVAKPKLIGAFPTAEDRKKQSSSRPRPSEEQMAKQNHLDALMDAKLTWETKTYSLPKKLPKALSAAEIKAKREKEEKEKKEEEEKKRKEQEKIEKKQAKMLKKLNGELFGDDSDSDSDEEEEEEEDPNDDTSDLWTHPPEFYLETKDPAIKALFNEDATPKPSGSANSAPPHGNPTKSGKPKEKPKTSHLSKIEEATRGNAKPFSRSANLSPLDATPVNPPPLYASQYGNPRESVKQNEKPKKPMHSSIPKKDKFPTVEVPKNTSRTVKSQEKSPNLNAASVAANLSHTPDVGPKSQNAPRSSRKAEKTPAEVKPVAKTAVNQILGTKYIKKYSWMTGENPVHNSGTKHTPIAIGEEEEKGTAGTQTPIQQVTGASDANVQNSSKDALLDQEGAPATQNHNAEENGNGVEADLEKAFAEDEELDRQRQLEKDRAFGEAPEEEEEGKEPENTPFYGANNDYGSAVTDRIQNHEYGPDVEVYDIFADDSDHDDNTAQLPPPKSEGLPSAGNMSQPAEPIEKAPYRQMRNKKELKAECESRGLNVGGNWDMLVTRLEENDRLNARGTAAGSIPNQPLSPESGGLSTAGNKRQPRDLVEDKSYNSLNMEQLKEILRARNLKVKGNKPDLVTRLEQDDLENPQEIAAGSTANQLRSPESESPSTSEKQHQPAQQLDPEAPADYNTWKAPELKAEWKARGLKGADRKNKPELVAQLEAYDRERTQEMVANLTPAESEQNMQSTVARAALANVTNTKSQKAPVQSNAKKVSSGRVEKPKASRKKATVDQTAAVAMMHEARPARPSAPASNFDMQKALSMTSAIHTPGPTMGINSNDINEFAASQPAQSRPRGHASNAYASGSSSMAPGNHPHYTSHAGYTSARPPTSARPQPQQTFSPNRAPGQPRPPTHSGPTTTKRWKDRGTIVYDNNGRPLH